MSYLGYEYKKELTQLTSRITMAIQSEIALIFFSEVNIDPETTMQGFTISRYTVGIELAQKMTEDLSCIHVNLKDSSEKEALFLIAKDIPTVQKWYDSQRNGKIATELIGKFGYMNVDYDSEAFKEYNKALEERIPKHIAV